MGNFVTQKYLSQKATRCYSSLYRSTPLSKHFVEAGPRRERDCTIRHHSGHICVHVSETYGMNTPSSWRQQSHVHRQRQPQTTEHCDAECNAVQTTTASLQQCPLDLFFHAWVAVICRLRTKTVSGYIQPTSAS